MIENPPITALVSGYLLYGKVNTIGRDHDTLGDVAAIARNIAPGGKTSIHTSLKAEYSLLAYLQRWQ